MPKNNDVAAADAKLRKSEEKLRQLHDFDELLVNADDLDQRTKSLWVQIYRNACSDREQASVFVTDLLRELTGSNPNAHAMHGGTVVKYLEKMAKANDQLLKLAEQVSSYRTSRGDVDSDELLDMLQGDGS